MKRPSKKEIKEAIDRLKDKPAGSSSVEPKSEKFSLGAKKDSKRIRKQGV